MKKENKMDKAKNKAKKKVAAKIGKAGKTAAKAAVAVALAAFAAGCIAPGNMEQPARSQTMNNDFHDCIVIANARQVTLDTKAKTLDAEADTMSAPLELWTQTQANEGSETVTPTATSTPSMTIDTDAALDVPLNKGNTGTSAAGGAAEKLLGAGVDYLAGRVKGAAPKAKAGDSAAVPTCPDGNCEDGTCADGNCAIGDCPGGNCGE